VALDVELVLLEPRNVELLARSTTLQLAGDVLLVVSNNPGEKSKQSACSMRRWTLRVLLCDDASGADAFGTLGDKEHALFLDRLVNVITLVGAVGNVIVGDIVDLVLFKELDIDNPGAVFYDFIHPFAVSHRLGALLCVQNSQALATVRLLVACDADEQVDVGEGSLGLLKLAHVSV
jgi:hypothetical protein